MPCNYPGKGIQAPSGALTYYGHIQIRTGKIPVPPPNYKEFPLPCGKCTGCRLEYARQWAVRIMHERELHQLASFVTLTMTNDYLLRTRTHATCTRDRILNASLEKGELRSFTKRLNEDVRRRSSNGIKYYACGEYGGQTARPHYHIAIFGEDFSGDRTKHKLSNGNQLWRSPRLNRLWPHGDADIGELTFESAAYIARYIMKKITGTAADANYRRTAEDGSDYWLQPEFCVMSRGGRKGKGIASDWFKQFKADVYPSDTLIVRGHPSKPPRYYDKLLEALAPYEHALIKEHREKAPRGDANNPARLEAREIVTLSKLKQTKRSLE